MIQLIGGAFVWRSGLAIDCDGCPRAYNPLSKLGLDDLANAGKPGNWWGLACNQAGVPYTQGPTDPAPGFYVSTTSLCDRRYGEADPRRYVDSETVPYITMTRDMMRSGSRLGDMATVLYNGALCSAIVADVGPHPGEGSMALAEVLGIPSDPRRGGISSPVVSFILFSGSAKGWPRDDIDSAAKGLFAAWGGESRLAQVLSMEAVA